MSEAYTLMRIPVRLVETVQGIASGSLVAVPRSLLEAAAEFLATGSFAEGTCMCGSPMEAHDIGSGHSPVDAGDYHARSVHEQIAAIRGAVAQEPGHE